MKKRFFAFVLAVAALLSVTGNAGASLDDLRLVCRLRGVSYESIDDALSLYEEGDILELLTELHRCCQLGVYDGEIRVRGVDGVRVYDDLFTVGVHQELQHRVEGGVHIFQCVDLKPDPSWPLVTVEEGTVPYGRMWVTDAYSWPGDTVRVEVSPYPGCELASFTVLDSEFNAIPSRPAEKADYGSFVYYEFVLPAENLPVKIYATIRPVDWTDEDCPSEGFTDVPADAWYHMALDELKDRGVINGRDPERFVPYGTLTRAEAVTILYRLMDSPETAYTPAYTDVPEGAWFADAVLWADGEGIVNGVGSGLFAPNAPLTWEQLLVMLLRLSGEEYDFFRLDTEEAVRTGEVSAYAADALTWALDNGIYAADPIHGRAVPTRAETAVTVYLYLQTRSNLASVCLPNGRDQLTKKL